MACDILVVENYDLFRSLLVRLLSRQGYAVQGAKDGLDALDVLQGGEPPRLLVLDLTLPRLNGNQLLTALRADPRWRSIPVVVLTASAYPPTAEALGVATVLLKPVLPQKLVEAVEWLCPLALA